MIQENVFTDMAAFHLLAHVKLKINKVCNDKQCKYCNNYGYGVCTSCWKTSMYWNQATLLTPGDCPCNIIIFKFS